MFGSCLSQRMFMLRQLWAVRRIVDLLDDATALRLEAAQEALRQIVRDIAQDSGVVVRKRGGWRVRRE